MRFVILMGTPHKSNSRAALVDIAENLKNTNLGLELNKSIH